MSSPLEDTVPASDSTGPVTPHGGAAPSRISRFEIEKKLGEGGNGVVWLARDPMLDRKVAIKILRSNNDADASQRLLREAQSAAKLVHENIIVIHEVGVFEERVYVAMEYVAGAALGRWQSDRPWRDVVACYVRAGRGLAAAHAAGLVHRDFKPDNVLVGDDGRVRVTDFGLVSVDGIEIGASADLTGDALVTSLTRTGAIMGTPRYMAPEQHEAGAIDARADQFAFCVGLYEGLFGRPPFDGTTYSELSRNVCEGNRRPPPAADVPAAITSAIMRGLSRQREDRFGSMTELLDVLAAALPVAPAPRRSRRRWFLLGAVLVVALAAVVTWRLTRPAPDPVPEAFDRGQHAFERGDYATAANEWRRALMLDPDLRGAGEDYVWNIALALDKSGDCRGARSMYQRYLTVATHADAKARANTQQRLDELGTCTPMTAHDAYKAGEAAYNNGDFQTAVEEFKRGFTLAPDISKDVAPYLFNMGQAYRQMGNCKEAAFAFKKYLAFKDDITDKQRKFLDVIIPQLDDCAAQQAQQPGSDAPP